MGWASGVRGEDEMPWCTDLVGDKGKGSRGLRGSEGGIYLLLMLLFSFVIAVVLSRYGDSLCSRECLDGL